MAALARTAERSVQAPRFEGNCSGASKLGGHTGRGKRVEV